MPCTCGWEAEGIRHWDENTLKYWDLKLCGRRGHWRRSHSCHYRMFSFHLLLQNTALLMKTTCGNVTLHPASAGTESCTQSTMMWLSSDVPKEEVLTRCVRGVIMVWSSCPRANRSVHWLAVMWLFIWCSILCYFTAGVTLQDRIIMFLISFLFVVSRQSQIKCLSFECVLWTFITVQSQFFKVSV